VKLDAPPNAGTAHRLAWLPGTLIPDPVSGKRQAHFRPRGPQITVSTTTTLLSWPIGTRPKWRPAPPRHVFLPTLVFLAFWTTINLQARESIGTTKRRRRHHLLSKPWDFSGRSVADIRGISRQVCNRLLTAKWQARRHAVVCSLTPLTFYDAAAGGVPWHAHGSKGASGSLASGMGNASLFPRTVIFSQPCCPYRANHRSPC